jgi:hypothetical protein
VKGLTQLVDDRHVEQIEEKLESGRLARSGLAVYLALAHQPDYIHYQLADQTYSVNPL